MFSAYDHFITSDGLQIRWGCLPPPPTGPRGAVVLLNGRTEYLEKYGETVVDLNRRGWGVYSLDWRGQGLSDRLTGNRLKGHVGRFRDYLDDLDHFVERVQHLSVARPLILMGHSMGGHIGLRFLRERRHPFAGAVLTAPMIDIQLPSVPQRLLRGYVKTAVGLGFGQAFAPGSAAYASKDRIFTDNPLTSDPERFQRQLAEIEANPRLALGGVTNGWLDAAFRSIDRVAAAGFARGLALPLLIARATEDRVVSPSAQALFARQAPDCRLVDITGARHELLMEADAHRRLFWRAFDRFTAALKPENTSPQPPAFSDRKRHDRLN